MNLTNINLVLIILSNLAGYQIKLVANGSDEARAPRFKDLRAIALA